MTAKFPKGLKAIDRNIATITTNASKLNDLIHATAMGIVNHAKAHGDCTRALVLVLAMPASMRRTMLIQWFSQNTPIVVKLSDKGHDVGFSAKYKALTTDAAKLGHWKLAEANDTPFYLLAEQVPEAKAFDLAAMLKMIEQLSKRIAKQADADGVDPALAEKAKGVVVDLDTIRAKRAA